MKNSVVYNAGSVEVKDPRKDSIVIYAHPGDKINLDFDISSLKKEVINGDLVIKTQSGGTVTIANYSIMFMQNQFPMIVDSLSQEYGYYDFLDGAKASTSSDNPDSVIVDRIVSTPKANINSGDFLATGREFLVNDYAIKELVGMIDVEEQHPILANDVSLNPYILLTLFTEGIAKNDVPVVFSYAGRTILNQEQPSTLPVVTRVANPKSAPIYGTKAEAFSPGEGIIQTNGVRAIAGGGDKKGNEYSDYMFMAEHLDYSSQSSSIYYTAYTGNQIVRGLSLFLTDRNVALQSVILQDVPDGVNFISTNTTDVQPLGSGSFLITPKGQGPSVDLYFTYNEANAIDLFGNSIGLKDIMQQIRVSIDGYNAKYEQLVIGNTEVTLDFREVRSSNDVYNFSLFNTFTYSTLFDPLLVTLSRFDDRVDGGVTNHTYDLLEGDDVFYSGEGSETVYMGEGDDIYYYSFGSDIVDGKATIDNVGNAPDTGIDRLRFSHDKYVNQEGTYLFNRDVHISFTNGDIKVFNEALNSRKQKDNSNSSFTNFDEIYLEEGSGISSDQNNTVTIGSTVGFSGLKIYSGGGDDTLILSSAALLDFTDADGASVTSSARLNPTSLSDFNRNEKIIFTPNVTSDKDRFTTIIGSSGNDYFLASDEKSHNVKFDGKGGRNTIDFSMIQNTGLTFNVTTGFAEYGSSQDTLLSVQVIIGTKQEDLIYGSGTGSVTIYGISPDESVNDYNDTVTYSEFKNTVNSKGIVIDYVTGAADDKRIEVIKANGSDKDILYSIKTVEASQSDDIFKLAMDEDYIIDGLDGKDTMDYNTQPSNIGLTIRVLSVGAEGATGEVEKGANKDNFSQIEGIIGTSSNDVFLISGAQEGEMSYYGGGSISDGYDTINYSATSGMSMYYDLTAERLTKEIIGTNKKFVDIVQYFNEIIGTVENDTFVATNDSWKTSGDLLYNAYDSQAIGDIAEDPSDPNKLLNAGDVLYFQYNTDINLSVIEQKFQNFETLRLGKDGTTVFNEETSFQAIWGDKTAKDTFSSSTSSSTITYEITGALAVIGSLKLYNFDILEGSSAGTDFNVTLNPTDLSKTYYFKGGQSLQDVLNYSNTDSSINLEFDLGSQGPNDKGSVTKNGDVSTRDEFEDIESFVGGAGNDKFYLNPFNTTYRIDGGEGVNTVSFKNYSASVSAEDISYDLFINIQGYELTSLSDSWVISSSSKDTMVSGGAGVDTLKIGADVEGLSYTINSNTAILDIFNSAGVKQATHTLSNFEILNGTSAATAVDRVTIETDDNSFAENKSVFFVLNANNNAEVNYSAVTTSPVVLDVHGTLVTGGIEHTILVSKGINEDSFDYYSGVKKITLTNNNDTIRLDITDPTSYAGLTIDAGGGDSDTIDLSHFTNQIIYDSVNGTIGGYTFNITNWEILKTGDGDDIFKLKLTDRNQIIHSGFGDNELDLSNFSDDLLVSFIEGADRVNVDVNTDSVVQTTGIKKITGGSGSNTFKGNASGSYIIDGGSSTTGTNVVDYSSSSDSAGFSFTLTNMDNTRVTKGASGNSDQLKNIQKVIGTNKDDSFIVYSDTQIKDIDGGAGRDELVVVVDGATQGFNFDLDNNILSGGNLTGNIAIRNFEVLNGSSLDDTFTISSEDVLNLKGEIRGNGGNDTLNAKIVDSSGTAVGLYLDLSKGFIYKNVNNTPSPDDYISINRIYTINLGDGENIFVFTGSIPTPPTGTKYTIDLGNSGNNLLSFEQINYALVGTYQDMINNVTGGSGSSLVDVTNFDGLKLTNYSDELKINQGENALIVDGNAGNDLADYSAVTVSMTIDLTSSANDTQEADRGGVVDKLKNFERFILGSGADTVTAGAAATSNIDGGAGRDTISYEGLTAGDGGVIARLNANTIYKNKYSTIDTISNFEVFKDSQGDDIVFASLDYDEIYGSAGNDTLDLSALTSTKSDTVTYGYAAAVGDSRFVGIQGNAKSINIKTTTGATDKEHSYKKIIFGDNNVEIKVNAIEGRDFQARTGNNNHINYSGITGANGIEFDFSAGSVVSNGGSTTEKDTFSYINVVTGTDQDDRFIGLSASSKLTINAGAGNDTVSFTGSSLALDAEVKSDGTIDTGANGVQINKISGTLIVGGTRYDDIFYIKDLNVLTINGGLNGEGGTNTLDFSKLTNTSQAVTGFDIANTARPYTTSNMQRYVFTNNNDQIQWIASATAAVDVKNIDFGGGNDQFDVKLNALTGANIVYSVTGAKGILSLIPSAGSTQSIGLENLEKLNLDAGGGNLGSFQAIFKGIDYTSGGGNIFSGQIGFNNITFTDGVTFEYRDYLIPTFDTGYIIANVTNLNFLGSSITNTTMNVTVRNSTTQVNNVNITIFDKVNMTLDSSIANNADLTYDGKNLSVSTSAANKQIFNLIKMSDSTLNIGNQSLKVISDRAVLMPSVININYNNVAAGIDFSQYTGQHGNSALGTDWMFSAGKLTGRLANDFAVNFNKTADIDATITLTASNDFFSISQDRENLNSFVKYDGAGGTNTFALVKSNSTHMLSGLTNLSGQTESRIWISSSNLNESVAGSNIFADYEDVVKSNGKEVINFTIFDARADGVNKDMSNSTIINVILDPNSQWTHIYMPYAKAAPKPGEADYGNQDNMQRTILNAAGYATNGTTPNGGFREGGSYVVSFEQDINDLTKMNRMMQVEARLKDTPSDDEKIFNVYNVQSIYGRKGKADTVTFNSINTEQFNDLVDQLSQGNGIIANSGNNNNNTVTMRKQYLYLDLDFGKDETGSGANNIATNPSNLSTYDTIDFSSWQVNNPTRAFDMELVGIRGQARDDGLHMFGLGRYEDDKTNIVVLMKASGSQHIILPQSKFYHSLSTSYFARTYILEFPDIKDSNYYATYDAANGNYQVFIYSLFKDSEGTSIVNSPGVSGQVTLINFSHFFLAQTDSGSGRTITANIGEDFGTKGLFENNNVHLYFDQTRTAGLRPTDPSRSNNVDQTTDTKSEDKVDFSGIDSGIYYFSWGAWQDREHKSEDFVSTNENNNGINYRQASANYETFIKGQDTGVGLIFTNYSTRNKVGSTDGLGRDVGAFYRMQGVNNVVLTKSADTYALGEIYWSNNGPVGPLVNAKTKTFIKSVDGTGGIDTLLDNTFTSDTRKSDGGFLDGDVKSELGNATYSSHYYLTSGGTQEGHVGRYYFFDSSSKALDMRATSTPDNKYGAYKLGNSLATTKPNASEDGTYAAEFARATYNNFEKLVIEDYGMEYPILGSNIYTGVHDDVSVKASVTPPGENGRLVTTYTEFNLGGRYFSNISTSTSKQQHVMHEGAGNQIRFQFIQDSDKRVDSSVVIADGYNGSNYTSYYGYKNWDWIDLNGPNGAAANVTFSIIFNTDFNFDVMYGKEYTIDFYQDNPSTQINIFFQQQNYNYSVALETDGGSYKIYRITSDDDINKSFTFKIWSQSTTPVNYKSDAQDTDLTRAGFLTDIQLRNLQEFGNIEGIDYGDENEGNPSDSNSADGVSSYGSRTIKENEEDIGAELAYSDGSSGITSFGRASKSVDSKSDGANVAKNQDSSKKEDSSSILPEEDLWWLDNAEESEEKEQQEDNYAEDSMNKEEELEASEDEISEDIENVEASTENQEGEQQLDLSLLDKYKYDTINENNVDNLNFDGFVEKENNFNMDDLFNNAENLLSDNVELSDSLNEMIEAVNSLEEEALNVTNQYDELDSMSFALDSMFSVDENTGNTEVGVDNNNKNKNNNNFSNS